MVNHMFLLFCRRKTLPTIITFTNTLDSNAINFGNIVKVLIQ